MDIQKDNEFNFCCTNPTCDVLNYSKHFLDDIFLWGFIFLTNGNDYLIGVTCVDCGHTSIRKFDELPGKFPFDLESRDKNFEVVLKHYVPFSPEILDATTHLPKIKLKTDSNPEDIYYVPEGFTPIIDYKNKIDDSLLPIKINIQDINILNEYENEKKLKVLPRIVAQNSVYRFTENWLDTGSLEQIEKKLRKNDGCAVV